MRAKRGPTSQRISSEERGWACYMLFGCPDYTILHSRRTPGGRGANHLLFPFISLFRFLSSHIPIIPNKIIIHIVNIAIDRNLNIFRIISISTPKIKYPTNFVTIQVGIFRPSMVLGRRGYRLAQSVLHRMLAIHAYGPLRCSCGSCRMHAHRQGSGRFPISFAAA